MKLKENYFSRKADSVPAKEMKRKAKDYLYISSVFRNWCCFFSIFHILGNNDAENIKLWFHFKKRFVYLEIWIYSLFFERADYEQRSRIYTYHSSVCRFFPKNKFQKKIKKKLQKIIIDFIEVNTRTKYLYVIFFCS